MFYKHFTNEEDFLEYFAEYYSKLIEFVESVSGNNRWWFEEAYLQDNSTYSILFTSYKTPEYRNFLLSTQAEKINDNYKFSIVKQITDLVWYPKVN